MPRRQGLTDAEIEAMVNLSPTASECSEIEAFSDESEDDDYFPANKSDSSDSDAFSEEEEVIEEEEGVNDELLGNGAAACRGRGTTRGGPGRPQLRLGRGGPGRPQLRLGRGGRRRGGVTRENINLAEEQDLDDPPPRDDQILRGQPTSRRGRGARGRGGRRAAAGNVGRRNRTWESSHPDVGEEADSSAGLQWTRVALGNAAGRRGAQNVLRETPGPSPYAKRSVEDDSPLSAWRLFFSESMLKLVQTCTQTEARNKLEEDQWSVSLEELEAFIAIVYARGVTGMRTFALSEMWNAKYAGSLFRDIMPKNRFEELMRYLRFDIRETRQERRVTDKFCLASELWNKFIENCIASYKPTANMTVDEMLYPCKVRCPFTQYMPSKPDKYGIKYWLLCDAENRYVLNGSPYLGRDETRPDDRSLGEHVVLKLAAPFLGKGRNITSDNFFTSVKLCEALQKKNTSLVGTLRRSMKEVPYCVRPGNDPQYLTTLYKSNDALLTSYQGKVKKNVLVLSSMHTGCDINAATEKKVPETVEFYNKTKAGVDTIDQMCRKYSVRAGTRRWPVHVFYNILDLAMINAHTTYKLLTKKKIKRRDFILNVVDELAGPWKQQRGPRGPNAAAASVDPAKRRRCQVMTSCRAQKGNKTSVTCSLCNKLVCKGCQSGNVLCVICAGAED